MSLSTNLKQLRKKKAELKNELCSLENKEEILEVTMELLKEDVAFQKLLEEIKAKRKVLEQLKSKKRKLEGRFKERVGLHQNPNSHKTGRSQKKRKV